MLKAFTFSDTVDIRRMSALTGSMLEVLEVLDEGAVSTDPEYGPGELAAYVQSLVAGQRGSLGRTVAGSWSVAPNDSSMDADARVEFIFLPTYIAVATLSRTLCEFPLLAIETEGFADALRRGMVFASHRKLGGHGFEADRGTIDALRILSMGRIPWLLHRHPQFCPQLKAALDDVALSLAKRLANGTAVGVWGEDYSAGFRSAIETLRLTNDLDFMRSIEDARRDPSTISKEQLPW